MWCSPRRHHASHDAFLNARPGDDPGHARPRAGTAFLKGPSGGLSPWERRKVALVTHRVRALVPVPACPAARRCACSLLAGAFQQSAAGAFRSSRVPHAELYRLFVPEGEEVRAQPHLDLLGAYSLWPGHPADDGYPVADAQTCKLELPDADLVGFQCLEMTCRSLHNDPWQRSQATRARPARTVSRHLRYLCTTGEDAVGGSGLDDHPIRGRHGRVYHRIG